MQHVWERCQSCLGLDRVIVATDDERIADEARRFGAEVCLTREDHPSGSDRIAEAAAAFPECTHVVNVQGDEPLIPPEIIDQACSTALSSAAAGLAVSRGLSRVFDGGRQGSAQTSL